MTIQYACTYLVKAIQRDDFEKGCVGKHEMTFSGPMHVMAPTLTQLLQAIGKELNLALDNVYLFGAVDEEGGEEIPDTVARISYNRLETAEGYVPLSREVARWRRGETILWLADYDFMIERRDVTPIDREEFVKSGIKFHE